MLTKSRPFIVVVGATGTGKTQAAIALARHFGGTVVNSDSRQFYRGLGVVTAQPNAGELAAAPHLHYGIHDVAERMDAGSFMRLTEPALEHIWDQGGLPILCGGTGFYVQSLLSGIAEIPDVPEDLSQQVRQELTVNGPRSLHAKLAVLDPETAARLHPNDSQRICRAVEVYFATGQPLSVWQARQKAEGPRHEALVVGIEVRDKDVEPRLAARIEAMLEAGAIEEVRSALACGADPKAPGLSSIGAAELVDHLAGRYDLDTAKALWLKNTKAYAKRQRTWFRGHPPAQWFAPEQTDELLNLAETYQRARLKA